MPANDAAHLVLVAEQSLTVDARCLNVRSSLFYAIKIQHVLLITRSTSTHDSPNLHCLVSNDPICRMAEEKFPDIPHINT